jgi:hypothetical protein
VENVCLSIQNDAKMMKRRAGGEQEEKDSKNNVFSNLVS